MIARDVDRHIGDRVFQCLQQDTHLDAGAAAEFDQTGVRTDPAGDVAGVPLKNSDLGPGQIIFRDLTDRIEQLRTLGVVEQFARQRLRFPRQAAEYGLAEIFLSWRQIVKDKGVAIHQQSSAKRSPENAHRAAGGKKLRYVVRMWSAEVTAAPPRNTIWLDMNLPLYSPTAPAAARKPRYGV